MEHIQTAGAHASYSAVASPGPCCGSRIAVQSQPIARLLVGVVTGDRAFAGTGDYAHLQIEGKIP